MSAVVLGLAVDFKPWALPFVAIVLIAPRRQWVPGALVWVAVVAVCMGAVRHRFSGYGARRGVHHSG